MANLDIISFEDDFVPEDHIWELIRFSFSNEEAIPMREYAVGVAGTVQVADFVILHRDYGLLVLEVKAYQIDDIQQITDQSWVIQSADFRSITRPTQQIDTLLQAIKDEIGDGLDVYIPATTPILVLPYISRRIWRERFGNQEPWPQQVVLLFQEDLSELERFKEALRGAFPKQRETIEQRFWEAIQQRLSKRPSTWDVDTTGRRQRLPDRSEVRIKLSKLDRPLIFLSYRRQDSAWAAGRLYGQLNSVFEGKIFWDYDSIKPGTDWIDAIDEALSTTVVLIAVIGKKWLLKRGGKPRIFDPKDKLAEEIQTALDKGKVVIPVLIDDTDMPKSSQLPRRLKSLSRKQALRIYADNFFPQTDVLIDRVIDLLLQAGIL